MSNNIERKVPTELGTESVGKLLMQYAIPAIIAQIAASLYNLIDRAFIGHMPDVGINAIAGLTSTFPFMNLSVAFGAMIGVGGATLLSVRLGQRDYYSAKNILGNLVSLNIVVGVLFAAISFIFIDEILLFFGADADTLPYARDYMVIILLGNIITHLYFGINAALRSSGHPKQAMKATIMTVLMNAVLTPIFIFVFDMGVAGAAWATNISQAVAGITCVVYMVRKLPILQGVFQFSEGRRGIAAKGKDRQMRFEQSAECHAPVYESRRVADLAHKRYLVSAPFRIDEK